MDSHRFRGKTCIHRQSFAECPHGMAIGSLFQWFQFDRDGRAQARRLILAGLRNHLGAIITGPCLAITYCRNARRDRLTYVATKSMSSPSAPGWGREIPTEWFLQDIRD